MLELDESNTLCLKDREALKYIVTSILKPNLIIAEIGSWKGHSASIIADLIKESGGHLYCVDHWKGDAHSRFDVEAKTKDIFAVFRRNMVELGLWDIVHPMYMDSITASEIFADNMLDMVFIDGTHTYECVRPDILGWYPKLKLGGIMCGHDWDNPLHYGGHAGVTQAIEELLDKDYDVKGDCIWVHTKNRRRIWQEKGG